MKSIEWKGKNKWLQTEQLLNVCNYECVSQRTMHKINVNIKNDKYLCPIFCAEIVELFWPYCQGTYQSGCKWRYSGGTSRTMSCVI